ncbi:MAG: hypothetical protein ACLPUO_04455 [Streptosporangiaceae bacterium]|jgi:hypothetical protein
MTTAQQGSGGQPGSTGASGPGTAGAAGATAAPATSVTGGQERGAHRAPGYEEPAGYSDYSASDYSGAAVAGTVLAGVWMILAGLWDFFIGIAAIINGAFYHTVRNYPFSLSIHGWGWMQLIIGCVVVAAGVGVLLGLTWARVVGVVVVALAALGNFMFIPFYPFWSILLIALDIFVIWALVNGMHRERA